MSQQTVDLVRGGFEAFARGDIESVLRLCDEDILVTHPFEIPDVAPVMRGHAGVLESIAAWPEQWDDYRLEILKTVDIEKHVVATVHQTGRGKSTGIPVELQCLMVFTIRQGKIAEWRIFLHEDEALEALGLREQAMSQEEIVRRMFDAANERDLQTLEALLSEDVEFQSVLFASEGGTFRGRRGIREYFAAFDEAFAEYRSEVEEVVDAGEDRVVALVKFTARGKESGVTLDQPFGLVITFRGEQISRMDSYFNRAEAVEAAGLREQLGHS
jgi:ketosteroid isomerase-like protein